MEGELGACVRAKMEIELADGRVITWEAQNPRKVEVDHGRNDIPVMPAESFAEWAARVPVPPQGVATLRVEGGWPWQIEVMIKPPERQP